MSIVLWSKGNLFADSAFENGSAGGTDFSKVIVFKRPVVAQVRPVAKDSKPLEEYTDGELKENPSAAAQFVHCLDVIFGGFFAGSLATGKSIMAHIEASIHAAKKEGKAVVFHLEELVKIADLASSLCLVGENNAIDIVLVGGDRLYELKVGSNGDRTIVKERSHMDTFGFGTGGDYVAKNPYLVEGILDGTIHPSVGVQLTIVQDRVCGGWVEWWALNMDKDEPDVRKSTTFNRLGIYKPRTSEDMKKLLAIPEGRGLLPDYLTTQSGLFEKITKVHSFVTEDGVEDTPGVVPDAPRPKVKKKSFQYVPIAKRKSDADRLQQPRRPARSGRRSR